MSAESRPLGSLEKVREHVIAFHFPTKNRPSKQAYWFLWWNSWLNLNSCMEGNNYEPVIATFVFIRLRFQCMISILEKPSSPAGFILLARWLYTCAVEWYITCAWTFVAFICLIKSWDIRSGGSLRSHQWWSHIILDTLCRLLSYSLPRYTLFFYFGGISRPYCSVWWTYCCTYFMWSTYIIMS